MAQKHIAVLMGGLSPERSVSLASGKACAAALAGLGYRVSALDVGRDIALKLAELKPDLAFNALHGPFGEDGTIQGILEYLQIPYTHSGVLASALAMDKGAAKIIAAAAGVHIAPSVVMNRFDLRAGHPLPLPYVVKPVREGSSFGVVIVREGAAPPPLLFADDWRYGDEIMAEAYIAGRELTCAVMADKALDVCEIVPKESYGFYDYEAKYASGGSKHICPAKISPNIYRNIQRMSVAAHRALGCRGISRSDFRYDEQQSGALPVWLELNTQPGMTPTSLVPDIAGAAGYSFADIVRWAAEDASCGR